MSKDCPLADTRVLDGRKQKISKIIMFDSQEYRQDRPQGLWKRGKKHSRIWAWSQLQYDTCATVHGLLYVY